MAANFPKVFPANGLAPVINSLSLIQESSISVLVITAPNLVSSSPNLQGISPGK